MARAIAGGLIRSGYDPTHILIAEPLEEQRAKLQVEFPGSTVSSDNNAVVPGAGTLVLAGDLLSAAARAIVRRAS